MKKILTIMAAALMSIGLMAAALLGVGLMSAAAMAGSTTNPCAANPCAVKKMNPCAANPCAAKKMNPCAANPCATNPCAAKKMNPCATNPCAAKKMNPCAVNPCAAKKMNPCAVNPCSAKKMNPCAANPCAANPGASDGNTPIRPHAFDNFSQAAALGEKMWNDENLGTSGLACLSCHADYESLNLDRNRNYPHFVEMVGDIVTLDQMINYCMVNPMQGKQFEKNSKELTAMAAYFRAYRMKYRSEHGQ